MTARARVEPDFMADGVAIYLGRKGNGILETVLPLQVEIRSEVQGDHSATVMEPSLRLPEDLARALLDALAAHFGGVSDTQTLRKDYLAERARVDRMINYLTSTTYLPIESAREERA